MSDLIPAESMPGDAAEDVPVHYMPEPILELIISGKLGCVLGTGEVACVIVEEPSWPQRTEAFI